MNRRDDGIDMFNGGPGELLRFVPYFMVFLATALFLPLILIMELLTWIEARKG